MKPVLLFFPLFLLVAANLGSANPDNEVLVLLDNLAVRETHSIFFKSLNGRSKISRDVSA